MSDVSVPKNGEAEAPSGEKPRRRRLPLGGFSVRARILAAVVGLAAMGLIVAGYTVFFLQQIQVEDRINAELQAGAEEFVVLHESGIDPQTGSSQMRV
ncbi:hypothetical protein HGQ17_12690 [Nesterenkonia sp. MY13]|uniref:Uncharacterized protein n=1 Tax=Nesterenkonia sedimenti TaxID=1463632 RepID=A0A7X8TLE0_9MICC|nr:hypothetical protein [Nesterenkonia sedimenti]NLS10833.1 hypothetical protein [Nesterenkonia sedimenti]